MAIKVSELAELSLEELQERLDETREELFNLRFQNATGQLDNYKRLGDLRRDVARIATVMRQRELTGGAEGRAGTAPGEADELAAGTTPGGADELSPSPRRKMASRRGDAGTTPGGAEESGT